MERVLETMIGVGVLVYIDDVLISERRDSRTADRATLWCTKTFDKGRTQMQSLEMFALY